MSQYYLLLNPAADPVWVGVSNGTKVLAEHSLETMQLAEKLLASINQVLRDSKVKLEDLAAIGIVNGPGRFTSLRIACAVTNALASAHDIPIIPVSGQIDHDELLKKTIQALAGGKTQQQALPHYDQPPTITKPKAG